ncbi:uncharacterized protein LOC118438849 [Folsomia candida]|nr:uncharacterized protein LOC118438849 [Folsomia candida]
MFSTARDDLVKGLAIVQESKSSKTKMTEVNKVKFSMNNFLRGIEQFEGNLIKGDRVRIDLARKAVEIVSKFKPIAENLENELGNLGSSYSTWAILLQIKNTWPLHIDTYSLTQEVFAVIVLGFGSPYVCAHFFTRGNRPAVGRVQEARNQQNSNLSPDASQNSVETIDDHLSSPQNSVGTRDHRPISTDFLSRLGDSIPSLWATLWEYFLL